MKLVYSFLILLIFAGCALQDPVPNDTNQYVKFFGHARDEVANAIVETQDGGFLLIGSTKSFTNQEKAYVTRADGNGNMLWFKTYGIDSTNDLNVTIARSALQLDSGNFLVLGEGKKNDTTNFLLYEIDGDGNMLDMQQYATNTKSDQGFYITKLGNNEGFLLTGITNDATDSTGRNIKFIKINDARNAIVFERSEGINNAPDEITNVIEVDTDKGMDLLLSGTIKRGDATSATTDLAVIRATENGLYRFAIPFGKFDGFNQTASELKALPKDYIIVGTTDENANKDVYLVKVDVEVGTTRETHVVVPGENDGEEEGVAIESTSDGGFIVAGTRTILNGLGQPQSSRAFLMKLDASFAVEWVEEYGDVGKANDGFNSGRFVKAINGGQDGYILLGTFNFANNQVMGLVRTDSEGKTLNK